MEINNRSVKIVNYKPFHHEAFRDINIEWISEKFVVEDIDREVLDNPDKHILNEGGYILMAEYDSKPVATCALINEGNDVYELTKMGVDKNYRGLKIGSQLCRATIDKAKEIGAKKLILHSNREGSAVAVELYKKLGFVEVPLNNAQWKRATIKMEMDL
jgi:GNAT superfamily N-acetyltransferase